MSGALATQRRPSTRTGTPAGTTRPKLKVLNQEAIRQRARRRNALVVLFIVVLIGFFAVAFVHAQLVAGQQDLDTVRTRIAEAEAHRAKVARAVEEASSPQSIVFRAQSLGMVRAHEPVYLQAVAPVRQLQTAATFIPSGPPTHLDVAAGISARGTGISAGIAGEIELTSAEADPATTDILAQGATPQSAAPEATAKTGVRGVSVGSPTQSTTVVTAGPGAVAAGPVATHSGVEVVSTGGSFGGVAATTTASQASDSQASDSQAFVSQSFGSVTSSSTNSDFAGSVSQPLDQADSSSLQGTGAQQAQSSFAGSRAVSGGQGSG